MAVHQLTADPDTTTSAAVERLRDTPAIHAPGQFTCNTYLALGERDTLIDAGTVPGIVDAIRAHTDALDAVVLTHQHGDHVAQLDAVLDAFDPACVAYAAHPRRTDAIADGGTLTIGEERFEAVYTPGHADDHLAFVSDTTLFAGDLVVPNDQAFEYASFGSTDGPGPERERLIESLERLLGRLPEGVEHLYAGHGDAFHGDVRDVVETALERAERREPKYG